MNKAEFITLVDNPGNLDKSHIAALKNIAADFPYFQANHMLLAKALYNENHYEFEKQLKATALLVPDRELLYRFLHDLQVEEPEQMIPSFEEETAVAEALPVIPEEPEVVIAEPEPEAEPELVQELVAREEAIMLPEEIMEEQREEAVIIPQPEPEEVPAYEPEPLHEELPEPVAQVAEVTHIVEEPPAKYESIKEEEAAEEPELLRHADEAHSFTEWLMLSNKQPEAEPGLPPPVIKAEEPVTPVTQEPVTEETVPPVATADDTTPSDTPAKSNIQDFESILDKFIRENPSISRPKTEFYKPANMARQSIEEDDELVTETLANIYYTQGAYKKAIRAYEKLCLIYPHKISYFAALIQKIKEENKND